MKELFRDFEKKDKSHWIKKIRKDLKISDVSEVVEQHLGTGILQSAYCDFSEVQPDQLQKSYAQCTLNTHHEWQGSRYWLNVERLEASDPEILKRQALCALDGGSDGLELVTSSTDWAGILTDISIPHCLLALEGPWEQGRDFVTFLHQKDLPDLHGYIIIEELSKVGGSSLQELLSITELHPRLKCLVLKESPNEAGSLKEISTLLSKCTLVINRLLDCGVSLKQAVGNLQVHVQLCDGYLWEICRLRSLRILLHQVIRQYGCQDFLPSQLVIKATAGRKPGEKDSNQQLLRNTSQAMAGILGGCDLLSTLPHENGFSSTREDERRIARNVGLILREESYLHKVGDPMAGSYYMESLTHKMLKQIWEDFRKIEAKGGYVSELQLL